MSTCDRYGGTLVELVLGTVPVEERAAVLAHVERCAACELRLTEIRLVVDDVLLAAPEVEPDTGFETRALPPAAPRRRRPTFAVAAAVAASLATGGAGAAAVTWRWTEADRTIASAYRAQLDEAGGEYFFARRLQGGGDGVVFGYQGDPSWVLVTARGADGGRVIVTSKAGAKATAPLAASSDGREWSWGGIIPFAAHDVATVEVVDAAGASVLRAVVHE